MKKLLLGAALLLLIASPAHAWGPRGHRLVGHLAEAQLNDAARAEVERLLASVEDAEKRSLAEISTWADELRDSNPHLGRESASWHYVNIGEDQCRYEQEKHCPDDNCVVEAINKQVEILADLNQEPAERLQALKFVVHFVGDIHQPMHAGYAHDRGGNSTTVTLRDGTADGHEINLHSLWDWGLFDSSGSEEEHLERLRQLPGPGTTVQDAAGWAEESCALATAPGVYPYEHSYVIHHVYVETWRARAEERIALAGRRLAVLLNGILDPGR